MTNHTTAERPALFLTALEAATKSYAAAAAMPRFRGKSPAEIGAYATDMMARMIRTGHFIITDSKSAR